MSVARDRRAARRRDAGRDHQHRSSAPAPSSRSRPCSLFGYPPVVRQRHQQHRPRPRRSQPGSTATAPSCGGTAATLRRLAPMSFVGAVIGALLLLVLPPAAFAAIVPVLIGVALVLVLVRSLAADGRPPTPARRRRRRASPAATGCACCGSACFVAGIYGGYFGAAQGVLLMGLLERARSTEPLQRLNAYKNVLGTDRQRRRRGDLHRRGPRTGSTGRSSCCIAVGRASSAGCSARGSAAGCRRRCCAASSS